jgi:uncharacterized protein (TIGR02996 family)
VSPEPAFLRDIGENPADDTARLVYADWLDEQGDPRGRYLRAEVELAALPEEDERLKALGTELRQLRESLDAGWVAAAGKRYDVILYFCQHHRRGDAVKTVRAVTGLGLQEARVVVEHGPMPVLLGVTRAEAEHARDQLLRTLQDDPLADVAVRVSAFGTRQPFSAYRPVGNCELFLASCTPEGRGEVIRTVREVTGLGLRQGWDLLRKAPVVIGRHLTWEQAEGYRLRHEGHAELQVRCLPTPFRTHVGLTARQHPMPHPTPDGRYELLLLGFPHDWFERVVTLLREMTHRTPDEAARLAGGPLPVVVRDDLTWGEAYRWRERLGGCALVAVRARGPLQPIPDGSYDLVLRSCAPDQQDRVVQAVRNLASAPLRVSALRSWELPPLPGAVILAGASWFVAERARQLLLDCADVALRPVTPLTTP